MYLEIEFSKYILPVEIIINNKNVADQNLIKTSIKDFFDFGQENILDFDNSKIHL